VEDLILRLTENTSIFESILIVVLGLIFYFRLKNNTDTKIDKLETGLNNRMDKIETNLNNRMDKLETDLNDRIDKLDSKIEHVNLRLDNLYLELFKRAA